MQAGSASADLQSALLSPGFAILFLKLSMQLALKL
jgi:hypothetical protein